MSTEQSPEARSSQRIRITLLIVVVIGLALLALLLALTQCGGDDDNDQAADLPGSSSPIASRAPGSASPTASRATGTARPGTGDDGPIAHWTFDGDATDVTGNGHDATALGGATVGDGVTDLDGTDDAFEVSDAPDLNPTDAITISAWWNAVDFSGAGNNGLVDKGAADHSDPYYQYHLGVTGTQYRGEGHFGFWVAADGKIASTDYAAWTAGRLYHLVGTYDGEEVRLYVDGELGDSAPASGPIAEYGKDLYIARFSNLEREGVDFLPGTIEEVTIWDRALSADEVSELFAAGPQ